MFVWTASAARYNGYMGNRIHSIDRLIAAASGRGLTARAVENQVERVRERLRTGRDEEGRPLAPYADTTNRAAPLANASKLLENVRAEYVRDSAAFREQAEVRGQAATILVYQDKRRNFLGWGERDRELATDDLAADVFNAVRGGR